MEIEIIEPNRELCTHQVKEEDVRVRTVCTRSSPVSRESHMSGVTGHWSLVSLSQQSNHQPHRIPMNRSLFSRAWPKLNHCQNQCYVTSTLNLHNNTYSVFAFGLRYMLYKFILLPLLLVFLGFSDVRIGSPMG